jgi:hypothetical protein
MTNDTHLPAIDELVGVDVSGLDRDAAIHVLQQLLMSAVRLEYSTIPPYLTAMWSIADQNHPAAISVRRVVQQEMLHTSLAANLLVGIGGSPPFASPAFQPAYPGHLPGRVLPDLVVDLRGFDDMSLHHFVQIEQPDHVVRIGANGVLKFTDEPSPARSIGEFYAFIRSVLHHVRDVHGLHRLDPSRQITGPLARSVALDIDDADRMIDLICHQGEGAGRDPEDSGEADLAHYYRFLMLRERRAIERVDGVWRLTTELDPPTVFPVASVPPGGYPRQDVPAAVWRLLERFDTAYTRALRQLAAAWSGGGQGALLMAIETMFALVDPARALMRTEIGDGPATYAPDFQLRTDEP